MNISLMKKTFGILAISLCGLTATTVQADWGRDGYANSRASQTKAYGQQINARQDRQMQRIEAGKRTGRLTRAEFRVLMQEQRDIRRMERHVRADGRIGRREFQRVDRALDIANRNIRAEQHDRQARKHARQQTWFN